MEYQALYRKWRPLTFDDVVGQNHVAQTIKSEVQSGNVGHAFLFCGSRGTGKTSTARILSRAINCTNNKDGNPCNECDSCKGILDGSIMDVVEIDAASNSGVANIRSLRDEANYAAASVRYKVYIIDEVHALSKDAFNALLKLLEEPPGHVKFVLATTEANKVLDTISSRCQRFDFNKITKEDIYKRLDEICEAEMIDITPEALRLIASAADGALRDALSILEPCISMGKVVDTEYVKSLLGVGEKNSVARLINAVADNDSCGVLDVIEKICASGKNLNPFIENVIKGMRNVMVYAITGEKPIDENEEDWENYSSAAEKMSVDKAIFAVNILSEAYSKAKYMSMPRYLMEATLLRLCSLREESGIEAIAARLGEVEMQIKKGVRIDSTKEKPEVEKVEIKREPIKKIVNTGKTDDSTVLKKVKEKWPEIMSKIAMGGSLNLYMALENCSLRSFGEKIAIVFNDAMGSVLRDMIEGGLSEVDEIILAETGEKVALTVKMESDFDKNEVKTNETDPFDEIASLPWVNN